MPADASQPVPEGRGAGGVVAFRIAYQCAPVLKRLKASNLLVLGPGGCLSATLAVRESRVICRPLYIGEEREVVLLYRYDLLKRCLKRPEVREFLRRYGYGRITVSAVLARIHRRYQDYMRDRRQFPHELGAILGYPIQDVSGFIQNKGRGFLLSGYWKVYHDREQARRIFRCYDCAREAAVLEVMEGRPISRIASLAERCDASEAGAAAGM